MMVRMDGNITERKKVLKVSEKKERVLKVSEKKERVLKYQRKKEREIRRNPREMTCFCSRARGRKKREKPLMIGASFQTLLLSNY